MDATALIDEISRELQPVVDRLLGHPYVEALAAGQMPREQLRTIAGEQHAIIDSDLKSVAHLVGRFGGTADLSFFLDVLAGERAAWEGLKALAGALGMSEADLTAYEPLAGAHAYTCYMAWLALYGSAAEVAAAYLVNFPAWGKNCGRLSQILKERYGRYFRLGRGFARLVGKPEVMGPATRFLLPSPKVMGFAMRMMANLTDGRDGDAQDKLFYLLERLARAS